MRRLSIIFLLIFVFLIISNQSIFSAVNYGITSDINVTYSNLSEQDLVRHAQEYYKEALNGKDGEMTESLTNALMIYSILQKINPGNIEYYTKRGVLYDKVKRDSQAKEDFIRAIQINHNDPNAYFYYAEFFYKRQLYRKALKYYRDAYMLGYNNFTIFYKMGDIFEKFGDTFNALQYLKEAQKYDSQVSLDDKIKRIESNNIANNLYYSNSRIRG